MKVLARSLAFLVTTAAWLMVATAAHAATFNVTKTADTADGVCSGDCSLREAIAASNATPGVADDIVVPAGAFSLSLGELSITDALEIRGQGPAATSIVQTGAQRVLNITSALPVLLADLTIHGGNATAIGGGGIFKAGGGDLTLENSFVQHNQVTTPVGVSGGGGGGIFNAGPGSLRLERTTIRHNTATATGPGGANGGGGIRTTGLGSLDVIDSTVYENTLTVAGPNSGGGGLWSNVGGVGVATLRNSTFHGNTVSGSSLGGGGGGIFTVAADPVALNNLTVASNSVGVGLAGGGIRNAGGTVSISNSILAGNSPANCSGALTSNPGFNLDMANTCGFNASGDLRNTNPNLGVLKDNGGPTLTRELLPGSPAIEKGDPDVNTSCEGSDQRGVDRSNLGVCDIGAYEFDGRATAAVPPCSPTGVIPVNLRAATGHGVEALHYRAGGAGELIVPTPEGGSQTQRSITFGEGRTGLEYWGDFTNDPDSGQVNHQFTSVLVDKTKPQVSVQNPSPFAIFVIKRRVNVQVAANDQLSGLTTNPSGTAPISTTSRGAKTFAPVAVDLCSNQATAPFNYTVLAPQLGTRTVLERMTGSVKVLPKGGSSAARASQKKGQRFTPLAQPREIAIGSQIDSRKGRARITSSSNSSDGIQESEFFGGVFQVLQSRKRSAKGLTDLLLKGGSFRSCRSGRGKGASVARRLSRRTIRRLRSNAKGRFRTRGRYSSATVRGTLFTVTDRCDGTLTTVTRGKVAVRDNRRRKTIIVRAGKRYLARAPR